MFPYIAYTYFQTYEAYTYFESDLKLFSLRAHSTKYLVPVGKQNKKAN